MLGGRLARRYAKALVQLVEEQKPLESALLRDLERFCKTYADSADLRGVLTNPTIATDQRDKVLQAVLDMLGGVHTMTRSFLRLMVGNHRIDIVDTVRSEFIRLLDDRSGRVRAAVVTAVPLDPMSRTKLQKALEQLLEKTVVLETEVDKDILGGVVTRVGHVVFDGSLRAQLVRLRVHLAAAN